MDQRKRLRQLHTRVHDIGVDLRSSSSVDLGLGYGSICAAERYAGCYNMSGKVDIGYYVVPCFQQRVEENMNVVVYN